MQGAYRQSRLVGELKQLLKSRIFLLCASTGFVFWILIAAYDHVVTGQGTFLQCLVKMDLVSNLTRLGALSWGVLAGLVAHNYARHKEANQRLETLFERSSDAFVLIDIETGKFLDVNEKTTQLFRYSREQILQMTARDIHPHDWDLTVEFLQNAREKGTARTDVLSCYVNGGEIVPAELSASSFDYRGKECVLVGIRDITERKLFEEQLKFAYEESTRANKAKRDFLANMSHELRTPLNAIMGFCDFIRMQIHGPLGSQQYLNYANVIKDSADHLLTIISDILDVSRMDNNNLVLEEEVVDTRHLVERAAQTVMPMAHANKVDLHCNLPLRLPCVRVDPVRLKQVIVNLTSNAIKFTNPGGEVTIRMGLKEDGSFMIQVRDTGVGMSQDQLDHMFEPFYQGESCFSKRYEGAGLGLCLVKALIDMHDGRVDFYSKAGVGTTATVVLPRDRVVDKVAA